jgi:hypothetical protein
MFLCVGSIFSGYIFKDLFVGPGTDFLKQGLIVKDSTMFAAELVPLWVKLIPTVFSLTGVGGALFFCSRKGSRLVFFKEKGYRGAVFRASRHTFRFLINR